MNKKPNALLDTLKAELDIARDVGLCRLLGADKHAAASIRRGERSLSANMILAIHENTGMPVARIRALIAQST